MISGSFRGLRGGSWVNLLEDFLRSSNRVNANPVNETNGIGFRVASP